MMKGRIRRRSSAIQDGALMTRITCQQQQHCQ